MTVRWIGTFEPGDVTWALIGAASVFLLVLPGLLLLCAGIRGDAHSWDGLGRRFTLLAALTLGWCLWIYTLGFAPSIGSRPQGEAAAVPNDLLDLMKVSSLPVNPDDPSGRGGWLGSDDFALLQKLLPEGSTAEPLFPTRRPQHHLPHTAFLAFHLMLFLAAACCVEAIAGISASEGLTILFGLLWGTLVYAPTAHWLWGDGWLLLRGAVDSGAGLFYIVIGFSALACAFGPRSDRNREDDPPEAALS